MRKLDISDEAIASFFLLLILWIVVNSAGYWTYHVSALNCTKAEVQK